MSPSLLYSRDKDTCRNKQGATVHTVHKYTPTHHTLWRCLSHPFQSNPTCRHAASTRSMAVSLEMKPQGRLSLCSPIPLPESWCLFVTTSWSQHNNLSVNKMQKNNVKSRNIKQWLFHLDSEHQRRHSFLSGWSTLRWISYLNNNNHIF